MSHPKTSKNSSNSNLSISSHDLKTKFKGLFHRHTSRQDNSTSEIVISKHFAKAPMFFLSKRRRMQKIPIETTADSYTDANAGLMAVTSSSEKLSFEQDAQTFDDYTQKLEDVLILLRNVKREEYECEITLKILRFLEKLIHQPKEWISGAKLKLSEMKFPEMAMTLMNSFKEKGYLVRHIVFVHSLLLYNSMSNFTDQEFDKEGLIRKQSADAGFIEFACEILNDSSYRESLRKCYIIQNPEDITHNDDFSNYQKILYICDSALTILYNLANLPELKIHFRECNAMAILAEYTKLPTNTIRIGFLETSENAEYIISLKELEDIASAIRVTSCLLLPLIMNEDEDNLLAENTSEVLPLLSGMIRMYTKNDQRFYGFSVIELVEGLSKLMVRGRAHKCIDQHLVKLLLNILENSSQDNSLLECISSAILNASFDEKVQKFLDSDQAVHIITSTQNISRSQLVQKNCEAILWTLNRIPHKRCETISNSSQLQGHIMISYNRSVTAMCLKLRDRLKSLPYTVWLDVDNINGGVLESMAKAVENSSIVLICMNEQYKQSYYCRLEAEYATELRKPCIPCLMQPRFRPYGWLGIIKGAKIHVDFATLPFEEAFSLLIREIETIRTDVMSKKNSDTPESLPLNNEHLNGKENIAVIDWDVCVVKEWLERSGLLHLVNVFTDIDGKQLFRLHKMKQLSADSYYQFLNKHFERHNLERMSDLLRFDNELECLFR